MFTTRTSHTRLVLSRILALLLLLSLSLSGCGSPKPKVYRVGVLSGLEFVADITDGFKDGMAKLGYVEGQNIIYDVQKTDFDMEAYKVILQKFVTDKVDVIVAFPTEATMEAKIAIQGTDIPLVFTFALIEGMGIVDSVREPGGNLTGVRYPGPDIALKRFEVMRQLVPNAKTYLLPYQKGYPIVNAQLEVLRPAAAAIGITLIEAPAVDAADLEEQMQKLASRDGPGYDAILMLVEPLAVTPDPFKVMSRYAYENGVPIGGAMMSAGDYSSIFGINVNTIEVGRQTAPLVDKVLKGTPAGTISVVSSESFLEFNPTAAEAISVDVSTSLLSQANRIVH